MNEFKINQFITLKLENEKTFIYVKGKRFSQCKFLLLHTPFEEIQDLNLNSIDQMEEVLDSSLEEGNNEIKIPLNLNFGAIVQTSRFGLKMITTPELFSNQA